MYQSVKTNGGLITFTLRLIARGPIFVGSGETVSKKEYSFARNNVYFYDTEKFFRLIVENDLTNDFEQYMLDRNARSLDSFFSRQPVSDRAKAKRCKAYQMFQPALIYRMLGGNAITGTGNQPADIHLFQHNRAGLPYLPGSSVKGALRTAVTAAQVLNGTQKTQKPSIQLGQTKREIEKAAKSKEKELDVELFHTLRADEKNVENAVNSIFRGVAVADSAPINPKYMVLCRKQELYPDGTSHSINLIRQCLGPITNWSNSYSIDIPITLDQTLCGLLTPESILESIRQFDNWYTENVFAKYPDEGAAQFPDPNKYYLFLGGGAGFQSKTVTGPWLGDKALSYVSDWLAAQFGHQNRDDSTKYGVSPHILKCAEVNNAHYLFGLCEVEIL